MDFLGLLIGLWFAVSGVIYFIEYFNFIKLLKKSGVSFAFFWSSVPFYHNLLYRKVVREKGGLEFITEHRFKVRKYVHLNYWISFACFAIFFLFFVMPESFKKYYLG